MVNKKTLGELIRERRLDLGKRLRGLAQELRVTPSYLSDIENDRRTPSEQVLVSIARVLDLDFNALVNLAGRFGDNVEKYAKKQPTAVQLFRRIAEADLTEADLRKLLEDVEKTQQDDQSK